MLLLLHYCDEELVDYCPLLDKLSKWICIDLYKRCKRLLPAAEFIIHFLKLTLHARTRGKDQPVNKVFPPVIKVLPKLLNYIFC